MKLIPQRLAATSLVALLSAARIGAQIQTGDVAKRGLTAAEFPRTKLIAPGVYSYEALRAGDPGGQMTTVSLIVVTSDGVLVADGQGNMAQTKEMVDWIAKTTTQPIKYVVVGSDHGDHTGGNAALPQSATFIAHPTSKKVLEASNSARIPSETVSDRRTITLGGTEVQILFLGRAHTGGDLSVYLPKDRILFMSEAYLHRIFPAMRSAYPSEWVETVKKAEALNATWYIPGHGFVDDANTLKAELPVYRTAMERVIAEAKRLHDAGVTCARPTCDAVAQGAWGDLSEWTLFKGQVEIAIRRIYDELDHKLPPS
jgi:glyoxylase-like metal-dependent hydrolase (beta-lactamase superfamily II)